MPPRYLRRSSPTRLQPCAEFTVEACDTAPADQCCGALPCKLCLEWETYEDGIAHGSATFAGTSWTGTVGGLSGATLTWWRNRARTASFASGAGFSGTATDGRITSSVANGGALLQFLQTEWRQLRRYGGAKRTLWLAGSDFINALEIELRANGNYTMDGYSMNKATDGAMADITFKGNKIIYDPTLDDLGYAKRLYIIDLDGIRLRPMEGEDWKQRSPARPAQQYVLYRAKTWTGGLDCKRRNGSGVYEIV